MKEDMQNQETGVEVGVTKDMVKAGMHMAERYADSKPDDESVRAIYAAMENARLGRIDCDNPNFMLLDRNGYEYVEYKDGNFIVTTHLFSEDGAHIYLSPTKAVQLWDFMFSKLDGDEKLDTRDEFVLEMLHQAAAWLEDVGAIEVGAAKLEKK